MRRARYKGPTPRSPLSALRSPKQRFMESPHPQSDLGVNGGHEPRSGRPWMRSRRFPADEGKPHGSRRNCSRGLQGAAPGL